MVHAFLVMAAAQKTAETSYMFYLYYAGAMTASAGIAAALYYYQTVIYNHIIQLAQYLYGLLSFFTYQPVEEPPNPITTLQQESVKDAQNLHDNTLKNATSILAESEKQVTTILESILPALQKLTRNTEINVTDITQQLQNLCKAMTSTVTALQESQQAIAKQEQLFGDQIQELRQTEQEFRTLINTIQPSALKTIDELKQQVCELSKAQTIRDQLLIQLNHQNTQLTSKIQELQQNNLENTSSPRSVTLFPFSC